MKTKIYYFAYGSNLSERQMLQRCPHAIVVGKARVKNYQLEITGYSKRWRGGAATLVRRNDREVWGVVYLLDQDCLLRLNGFEGVKYRRYDTTYLTCHFSNGRKRRVLTYFREPRRLSHPSSIYRALIINGAKHFELPPSYIARLQTELR